MAKREANNAEESALAAQERALLSIREGYTWVMPHDMNVPVLLSPCCSICGSVVPVRNQDLHTAWHQS